MERDNVTKQQVEFRRQQFVKQIVEITQKIQMTEAELVVNRQRLIATQGALAALDEILADPVSYGSDVQERADSVMEV